MAGGAGHVLVLMLDGWFGGASLPLVKDRIPYGFLVGLARREFIHVES
jgi:hypothetical protein